MCIADKSLLTSHTGIYADREDAEPYVDFLFTIMARSMELWQTWNQDKTCCPTKFVDLELPRSLEHCEL